MSEINKILGKLEVSGDIGEQIDKQREQAEALVNQQIGARLSLLSCAKDKLPKLNEHVDKDLEAGALRFSTELEAASAIKKYLLRAAECVLNLADKAKAEELVAHGRVAALRVALDTVKRYHVSARARVDQLVAAAEEAQKAAQDEVASTRDQTLDSGKLENESQARLPGSHPGRSSLDGRRAEAAIDRTKHARKTKKKQRRKATDDHRSISN